MRKDLTSQILVLFIVAIAFVDGILFANHWMKKESKGEASDTAVNLDTVFPSWTPAPVQEEETPLELNIVDTPAPEPKEAEEPELVAQVPFTVQAPYGFWSEKPWSGYAEEAIVLMLTRWATDEPLESANDKAGNLTLWGSWFIEQFGQAPNQNIEQIQAALASTNQFAALEVLDKPSIPVLLQSLELGRLLVLPINGKTLESPYYADPAPEHHVLLLIGVNPQANTFVLHDPGTSRGRALEYDQEKILESIQDLDGSIRVLSVGI